MSELKIRPLNDRVIVKRIVETVSAGGILIPETGDKPQRGTVLAVGPGKLDNNGTLRPVDLNAGDEVLFGKYSGTEVKVDGQDLLIMREEDILGVVGH
ncbi:MAG: co-chaperone GroES [Gammaproteobacteria bacterium]|nr:co-chaperone GroES [Gammaproteobacteria bacterium]MBP9728556.1 co-chaperone GroES [Gammaproteobacteria bacterium]